MTKTLIDNIKARGLLKLNRQERVQLKKYKDDRLMDLLNCHYNIRTTTSKDELGHNTVKTFIIDRFDLSIQGKELVRKSTFQITAGKRYGIIGKNGTGKTLLLKAMAFGKIQFPNQPTIQLVEEELIDDDTTIVQCFAKTKAEQQALIDEIKEMESKPVSRRNDTYQPSERVLIIKSLGFDSKSLEVMACNLSGGWRMRISLACALMAEPEILLLDEPSNMLDSKSVDWLLNHLKKWKKVLIFASHDRSFMNNLTTDVIHISDKEIIHHTCSFRDFDKSRRDEFLKAQSLYVCNENKRKEINGCISKTKKSKKKEFDRMKTELRNLPVIEEPIEKDKEQWRIAACEKIKCSTITALNLGFSYKPNSEVVVENINVDIKPDSKICLIGHNGCGKTTLVKLLTKQLKATKGNVYLNDKTNIGYFSQHTGDTVRRRKTEKEVCEEYFKMVNGDLTAEGVKEELHSIDFLRQQNENISDSLSKNTLIKFGISEEDHETPMGCLSSGQRSRVVFASIALKMPNFLILDEPTNHLDMEGIAALEDAMKNFKGGVILVTHDGRLMGDLWTQMWYLVDGKLLIENNRY